MAKFRSTPASVLEEYHVESFNKRYLKYPASFQINYEDEIHELAVKAPLHIGASEDANDTKELDGLANESDGHVHGKEDCDKSTCTKSPTRALSIKLPIDAEKITMSLEEAITTRFSGREFSPKPLPLSKLAKILYLANGVRKKPLPGPRPAHDRNVPSSGGLASVEVFCIVMNVEGVEPGIYHSDSVYHELRLLKKGHFAKWIEEFVAMQIEGSEPPVVFVLTSAIGRLNQKYGPRSYRLGLMDVGHVSDNIYLTCTALGLNVFAYNGFIDTTLNYALDLDPFERSSFLCLAAGLRPE